MAAALPRNAVGKFRAIAVIISAVVFSLVVLMFLRGLSTLEQRALDAKRDFLRVAAERAQAELASGGAKLPEIAQRVARDPELVNTARALKLALKRSRGQEPSAKTKVALPRLMRRLVTRMNAIRAGQSPALASLFDALTIVDRRGQVVWTDSKKFKSGLSLGSIDGGDGSDADPPEGYASVRALLQMAVGHGVALATWFRSEEDREEIAWLAAATINSRDGVGGYVVVEKELLELPQFQGLNTILVADGELKMGEAPGGFLPEQLSDDHDRPFLLMEKKASSLVPYLGEVQISPFLGGQPRVGIWASSFAVPGAYNAKGYVMTDVTPLFEDLGGLQVITLVLAFIAWLVHAVLLGFTRARFADGGPERAQHSVSLGDAEADVGEQSGIEGVAIFEESSSGEADESTGAISNELASFEDFDPVAVETKHPDDAAPGRDSESDDHGRAAAIDDDGDSSRFDPLTSENSRPALDAVEPPNADDDGSLSEARSELPLASLPDLKSDVLADDELTAPRPPEVDEHYREVYAEFVKMRKASGENIDELDFERFADKLDQSRALVLAKHGATAVYFSVYLKDGRAALKARPSES